MTTGGFVCLIFQKDVRRYMWLLGMLFGMGLTITLLLYGTETMTRFYVILPTLFACLLGLLLTIDLIQIDWPGRDLQFISTRPVPGEAIFFAKMLFLGLLLVIGGWGFQELDYAVLGLPLQPLDHFCLLIETTIHFGTAMALVVLFALSLRKNTHVFFALCFSLMAILLLAYFRIIFPDMAVVAPEFNHAQLCWSAMVGLLRSSGFISVAMFAATVRYRTHKFGLPLALVIGGLVLVLVLCAVAEKIGENRLAHDRPDNIPVHLRGQVRLANYSFHQQTEQTAWNGGIVYHTVVCGPNVEGIEPPYYFRILGSPSTATLRSGKVIHSVVEQTPIPPTQDIGNLMGVPFEAEVIGVNSAVPRVSYGKPEITLRAFTYLPSRLPAGEDLTGVTIKGQVQMEIHRAYVAGSIPVEPGAAFNRPRQRYEITGVYLSQKNQSDLIHLASHSGGSVVLKLTCVKRPLALRGDREGNSDNLSWALVSQARNEILQSRSGGSGTIDFPIEMATSQIIYSKPGNNDLSPNWLKGAELVFLGNETCGQVTIPYEVDNVTLTR